MKLIHKKEFSDAEKERGVSLLNSIKIVVNVLFALLIFQVFLMLPRPGDPELELKLLEQIFSENAMQLLTILVGLILIIVYWVQSNLLLSNITRSTPTHAVLSLVQVLLLMIYLYFLRFDMEYDGMTIALQMESVFLALAGFVGAYNWRYAKSINLTSEKISKKEELDLFYKILPEPITSLFTLPFATLGAGVWTLAFLFIIPITWVLKIIRRKIDDEETK